MTQPNPESEIKLEEAVRQADADRGDIDAAIELGASVCKELGICCTEKGRVMFQVFKKIRALRGAETATIPLAEYRALREAAAQTEAERGGE